LELVSQKDFIAINRLSEIIHIFLANANRSLRYRFLVNGIRMLKNTAMVAMLNSPSTRTLAQNAKYRGNDI
jgi:hypothetical protein